ncbi:MAG: methylated-DNA--[protein]-cysteine S-methyltransferase [Firmicutes bacterium]|nr:methylated-DNA--[protein]-cysteine S-methyltransferase [Bacillota bacterium]
MCPREQLLYARCEIDDMVFVLGTTERGLCLVSLPYEQTAEPLHEKMVALYSSFEVRPSEAAIEVYYGELKEYFAAQRRTFTFALDLRGTPFQVSVWKALMSVSYGDVCSYGDIARRIDNPRAVRAVGAATGRNPVPIVVPCHRILGKNGTLTGYRGGLAYKQRLLRLEGVDHYTPSGHARFAF